MRYLFFVLLIPFVIGCGKGQAGGGEDGENIINGNGNLKFKTLSGNFESIDPNKVTVLQVNVIDGLGTTTMEKTFFFPDIGTRLSTLNLDDPGEMSLSKMKKTGSVTVTYAVKETLTTSRTFAIYNGQHLQDVNFQNVVYRTDDPITFDWLK